jgi:hypothetical protein
MRKTITYEPTTPEDLSHFFSLHKEEYQEMWIILTKKQHANPQPVSPGEAITEAIRHGLIDSRTKSIDHRQFKMRFTKRVPGSHWSDSNLRILERIKNGDM